MSPWVYSERAVSSQNMNRTRFRSRCGSDLRAWAEVSASTDFDDVGRSA
ncbi:hypothetical protein [Streptomyces sp. NPDC059063]